MLQKERHITDTAPSGQRKFACRRTRQACVGVFLLPAWDFARPAAKNPEADRQPFARAAGAVTLDRPTQPFRPFWLLFWPQNLTGQLCAPPRQLPAFGLRPSRLPRSYPLRAAPALATTYVSRQQRADAPRICAKARLSRGCDGRSLAHADDMCSTDLDDLRRIGTFAAKRAERPKGASRCVKHSFLPCLRAPRRLQPVATPPANKCSMVLGQGPQGRPCSMAALSPARPLALRATSSTARKTQAAANPASGARAFRAAMTSRFDAGAPPPRDIPVRGGFLCARLTHQHGPQGTAHV